MCELNYKGTKIEIGVKLEDQKYNFTYKKWSIYREPLRHWHVALTCGIDTWHWHVAVTRGIDTWQSTSKVNDQRPNRASKTNFAGIYKTGGPNLWIKL